MCEHQGERSLPVAGAGGALGEVACPRRGKMAAFGTSHLAWQTQTVNVRRKNVLVTWLISKSGFALVS